MTGTGRSPEEDKSVFDQMDELSGDVPPKVVSKDEQIMVGSKLLGALWQWLTGRIRR